MLSDSQVRVTFLHVKSNAQKITRLCRLVHHYFANKRKVLLFVQNDEAAQFLDDWLWKQPVESFLPHRISSTSSHDPVVITTSLLNLNQASILINLRSEPFALDSTYEKIYELMDESHPSKFAASQKKFQAYQSHGALVEILD